MTRPLALAALVLALAFVVLGCTKTVPTDTSTAGAPAGAPSGPEKGLPAQVAAGEKITVLMVPKLKGIDYFNACEKGAKEAAEELGNVELIYDGPTEDKVDAQIQLIEGYIAQKVDVIAVAPNDPDSIAPTLKKARDAGIHVLAWDADASAEKSGREFFVNQASPKDIGEALVDVMVEQTGPEAKVAIVTSSLTAANQNSWIAVMKPYMKEKYPKLQLVCEPKPSEEDPQKAFQVTQDLLKTYPDLQGVWGISSVAFPGAAEAVQRAKKSGKVAVVGLSTPKSMKQFVEAGTVKTVVLWNAVDLGYLTIQTARALCDGKLAAGADKITAGRLGELVVKGDQVLLGAPMKFDKSNIGQYDF